MTGRFDVALSVSCIWEHAECFKPITPSSSPIGATAAWRKTSKQPPSSFKALAPLICLDKTAKKHAIPSGGMGPGSHSRSLTLQERQTERDLSWSWICIIVETNSKKSRQKYYSALDPNIIEAQRTLHANPLGLFISPLQHLHPDGMHDMREQFVNGGVTRESQSHERLTVLPKYGPYGWTCWQQWPLRPRRSWCHGRRWWHGRRCLNEWRSFWGLQQGQPGSQHNVGKNLANLCAISMLLRFPVICLQFDYFIVNVCLQVNVRAM